MAENMLKAVLLRVKRPLDQFTANLCGDHGEEWLAEFKKFLRKEPTWVKTDETPIYELLGTIHVPAAQREFLVRKYFIVDNDEAAEIRIRYLSDRFTAKIYNKKESFQPKRTIHRYRLLVNLVDKSIITRLGGKEIAVTSMQDIWYLLKLQGKGEKGNLLTNGKVNLFLVYDESDEIMAISLDWNVFGWGIEAFSTELHVLECESNSQLFSN